MMGQRRRVVDEFESVSGQFEGDISEAENSNAGHIPSPEMGNLEEIAKVLTHVPPPFQRECSVSQLNAQNHMYAKALLEPFKDFGQKIAGTFLEDLRPQGYFQKNWTRRQIDNDLATFAQYLAEPSTKQQLEGCDGALTPAAVAFCRLVSAVTSKADIKLQGNTATALCLAFTQWLHPPVRSSLDKNGTGPLLHTEASSAITNLFTQHYTQITVNARSKTLSQLTAILQPLPPAQHEGGWHMVCSSQQRHALQALNAVFAAKPGNELSEDEAAAIAQGVTTLLQGITRPGMKLMEDVFHCDFYSTLLRTLNASLLEAKKWWPNNAGGIIDALSRFMLFGLQPKGLPGPGPGPLFPPDTKQSASLRAEPAGIGPSSASQLRQEMPGRRSAPGNVGRGSYCPPHRRRRDSVGSASDISDSDASDCEAGQGSDKVRLSKVRLQMLTCLQSMAKTQPKAMHLHWTSILPVHQPLQPRPLSPHLITMLLFDPISKVRSMAAATVTVLLEGTAQRGFLAVAEAKSVVRPAVRGFTTLSTSLGQLCLSVHTGLLHAIRHEVNLQALTSALRAAGTFLAAAPFERLPDSLLLEAVQGIHTRWQLLKHVARGEDGAALQSAVLAAIAAGFLTKTGNMKLKQWLLESKGVDEAGGKLTAQPEPIAQPRLLMEELFERAESINPILRMEALTGLKGVAALYTDALEGKWPNLLHIARYSLDHSSLPTQPTTSSPTAATPSPSSGNTSQDKAAHHAIKLLHTFLTVHSPARQDQEPADADERLLSLSSTTLHSSLSGPCNPSHLLPESAVDVMWCHTCELLLSTALGHVSSMVKSAAFSACSDIPDSALWVWGAVGRKRLEGAAAQGVTQDTAPAVRSAACKLYGVLCEYEECMEGEAAGGESWRVLRQGLDDPTMSVKVAAAAAVANLAGAYRRRFEGGLLGSTGESKVAEAVQQLATLVVAASQGAEKVRCHGVRALGHLLSFLRPEWLDRDGATAGEASVAIALECLQTGLATSSMKVQWNAAYAAASLLSNPALVSSPSVSPQLPGLLLLLLVLLRDSNNFKIRTHAALALTNADRATLDRVYADVVTVTLRVLEGLQGRAGGSTDVGPAVPEQGEDGNDSNFPNYRYTSSLQAQLKSLLLHLLAVAQPSDHPRLLDIISRRQAFFLTVASELLPDGGSLDKGEQVTHTSGSSYQGTLASMPDVGATAPIITAGATKDALDIGRSTEEDVDNINVVPAIATAAETGMQAGGHSLEEDVDNVAAVSATTSAVQEDVHTGGLGKEEDVGINTAAPEGSGTGCVAVGTAGDVSPRSGGLVVPVVPVVKAPSVGSGWEGPAVSERLLRAAVGVLREDQTSVDAPPVATSIQQSDIQDHLHPVGENEARRHHPSTHPPCHPAGPQVAGQGEVHAVHACDQHPTCTASSAVECQQGGAGVSQPGSTPCRHVVHQTDSVQRFDAVDTIRISGGAGAAAGSSTKLSELLARYIQAARQQTTVQGGGSSVPR